MRKIVMCWGFVILIYANAQSIVMSPKFFKPKFTFTGVDLRDKNYNRRDRALFSKVKDLKEYCDNNYEVSREERLGTFRVACDIKVGDLIVLMELSNFIAKTQKSKLTAFTLFGYRCANGYSQRRQSRTRLGQVIVKNGVVESDDADLTIGVCKTTPLINRSIN